MTSVAYYIPNIPDNPSTTRYNHAISLPKFADNRLLITYPNDPPKGIAKKYDAIKVLPTNGIPGRAKTALREVEQFFSSNPGECIFVTTFHYAPALAGWLSDETWVVDIYDDPHQLRYHDVFSLHQIGVWCLHQLLRRADRAIHTVHPSTPHTFGKERFFAVNGADITNIVPGEGAGSDETLHAVCAGVKGSMDILIRGIASSDVDIEINVFGTVASNDRKLVEDLGLNNRFTFHGNCDHATVIAAIETADIGFCLFANKTDWHYAHPIKVGEYLAGGTIPICSAYPGIRQLTRDSGMLVEYDPDGVVEALRELDENDELQDRLKTRCRQRAEAIDWREEREWFAKQALYGNEAAEY